MRSGVFGCGGRGAANLTDTRKGRPSRPAVEGKFPALKLATSSVMLVGTGVGHAPPTLVRTLAYRTRLCDLYSSTSASLPGTRQWDRSFSRDVTLSGTAQSWHPPLQNSHFEVETVAQGGSVAAGVSVEISPRVCASCCGSAVTLWRAEASAKPGGMAGAAQNMGPKCPTASS